MRSMKQRPIERAEAVSRRLAEELGFEHLETAFEKEQAGVYLRIYLDKPEGVTLDDCERFHRAVQPLIEEIDYDFLEVCSAGLDRPIKNARDAQKAMGQEIEVRLFKPVEGRKEFVGTLTAYGTTELTLSTPAGEKVFRQKDIALARRTVDLSILDANDDVMEDNNQ